MSLRELSVKSSAHSDAIWSVDWSSAESILTGGVDETLRVWTVNQEATGVEVKPKLIAAGGTILRTSSNESLPLSASLSLNTVLTLPGGDATRVASSSMDGTISLYDTSGVTGRKVDVGPLECWTLASDPSGQFLATGSQKGHVNIVAVASGQVVATLQGDKAREGAGTTAFVMSVAWSPDGRFVAAGHFDGRVTLFQMAGAQPAGAPKPLTPHTKAVRALHFSPDSGLLFSGSDDMHVHWYETAAGTGQIVHDLFAHQSWITGIDLPRVSTSAAAASSSASSAPTCFVTVSTDKKLKVWNLQTKECVAVHELDSPAWCVAFDPTGEKVAVGTEQGSLAVLKVSTQ